jgi:hypothetical protein
MPAVFVRGGLRCYMNAALMMPASVNALISADWKIGIEWQAAAPGRSPAGEWVLEQLQASTGS